MINSDTSVTLTTPYLSPPSGFDSQPIIAQVTVTAGNVQSNPYPVDFLTPLTPIVGGTNVGTSGRPFCGATPKNFVITAYVVGNNLLPIGNAQMSVEVGGPVGVSGALTTLPDRGSPQNFRAAYVQLPINQFPWPVLLSYKGKSDSASMYPPDLAQAFLCTLYNRRPGGSLVNKPIPIDKELTDPSLQTDPRRPYINDLYSVGAIPFYGRTFNPNKAVSFSEFATALRHVLAQSALQLFPNDVGGRQFIGKRLSREQAAAIVTSLVHLPGAKNQAGNQASVLVRDHYLFPLGGQIAGGLALSRIEMVNILWHVAAAQHKTL